MLVQHLLGQIASELHRNVVGVDAAALSKLSTYHWPGNIRELQNVLTRAVALSRSEVLSADAFELSVRGSDESASTASEIGTLRSAERDHIQKALTAFGWNITQTSKALEVSPTTLRKKIADFDLRDGR